jgi:hypothetical protein
MNYLKVLQQKISIAINGYTTPKKVLNKLKKYNCIIGNPPFKTN